jgi:RNA polymerase sigma-70 factor (ECF subfamily)
MNTEAHSNDFIEAAYAAHALPLRRRFTTATRDPAAAEDLTHEAFVRLLAEVQAGRTPDDVGAWLHRVAQNLATSRGRRITVAARHTAELSIQEPPRSPELLAVHAEECGSLRTALLELAQADRQVLVLAAQGYRGEEIARSIGRSDAATRTLLYRARGRLRGRMIQAGAG